jgi:pantetheine-phosphate adenylyltransferase
MRTHAVYGGSFDPITNGHVWMIEAALKLFDHVRIAIADNPDKKYTFTLDERIAMVEAKYGDLEPTVSVSWIGNSFLANYADWVCATHLLRGIRNATDAEYERGMRNINGDIHRRIETVFLMPPRELCEVSSSMVKGLVGPDGWEKVVERYVPSATLEALKKWRSRCATPK